MEFVAYRSLVPHDHYTNHLLRAIMCWAKSLRESADETTPGTCEWDSRCNGKLRECGDMS